MGNQNSGRRMDTVWHDALHKAVKDAAKKGDPNKLAKIAEKTVRMAEEGDMRAIKEIGDRLDGKPAQQIKLSGDRENPVTVIERVIVQAPDTDS